MYVGTEAARVSVRLGRSPYLVQRVFFISLQGTPLREGNECVVDMQSFVE